MLKVVIGSSAEQIFQQVRIPVLTVGPAVPGQPPFEAEFKNIPCATDFGPAAEREVASPGGRGEGFANLRSIPCGC